jgi:hypothetical protein
MHIGPVHLIFGCRFLGGYDVPQEIFMNSSPLHPSQARLEQPATRIDPVASSRPIARLLALALVATIGVYALSDPSQGQSAPAKAAAAPAKEERSLEGSWSGGGSVSFASGSKEQARCRAHYSRASKNSYRLNATCATASGKAAQSATLQKVGDNRYSGTFYNSEFDISGRIYVILRGSSQSVRLTSGSGSASFRLSR